MRPKLKLNHRTKPAPSFILIVGCLVFALLSIFDGNGYFIAARAEGNWKLLAIFLMLFYGVFTIITYTAIWMFSKNVFTNKFYRSFVGMTSSTIPVSLLLLFLGVLTPQRFAANVSDVRNVATVYRGECVVNASMHRGQSFRTGVIFRDAFYLHMTGIETELNITQQNYYALDTDDDLGWADKCKTPVSVEFTPGTHRLLKLNMISPSK